MELQSLKRRYGIVGNSPKLNHAIEIAHKVASTDLSVLITGESGVGKEAFSKIIHQHSLRKHEQFIALNCGAIPEGTIDSELFGHIKGSFTGAYDNRKGYFEVGNGGTIFLDEIGEMPIGTQARLLRILESGEYIKVGDSKVQTTDVRIIAATNVNLIENIKKGKFREDLYFRLNTVPIQVPPLRERGRDIELLFRKFLTDFAEKYRRPLPYINDDATRALLAYRWPGNVRQLKNIAEQLSIFIEQDEITLEMVKDVLPSHSTDLVLQESQQSINERELLYKMLFEMKSDLNNIKQYLWNNGHQDYFEQTKQEKPTNESFFLPAKEEREPEPMPVVIEDYDYPEDSFDESLNIADMEKQLIEKALEKHNGTRKKAALELGISERTLYRKIKEYELES